MESKISKVKSAEKIEIMETKIRELKKFDPFQIREDFPIFKRRIRGNPLIYLDNAATTQKPRSVIDAVKQFYEQTNANIHRAVHTLSYESTVQYEDAHKKVANFIGAEDWGEIVFTRNATEAINLVAYGWGLHNLGEGDEIVITIGEHHSNIVPWQMLRDLKGVKIKFVDVTDDGTLKLDEFTSSLSERTKLVGIIHISNVLGVINPVKQLVEKAKEVGALTLVDAAQSIPHIPVNVGDLGCDFLVASGHKMLGPTGSGFIYGKRELFEKMQPFLYGGDMIETVTTEKTTWNELPWKFEAGTPNIAGAIGLAAAIEYLKKIGLEKIMDHEKQLVNYAIEKMLEIPWIEIYGPSNEERIGVISFNIKGVHPHDVAGFLDEEGIAVRSGNHCAQPLMKRLGIENAVRASFYLYNTKEESDLFIEALHKVKRLFEL